MFRFRYAHLHHLTKKHGHRPENRSSRTGHRSELRRKRERPSREQGRVPAGAPVASFERSAEHGVIRAGEPANRPEIPYRNPVFGRMKADRVHRRHHPGRRDEPVHRRSGNDKPRMNPLRGEPGRVFPGKQAEGMVGRRRYRNVQSGGVLPQPTDGSDGNQARIRFRGRRARSSHRNSRPFPGIFRRKSGRNTVDCRHTVSGKIRHRRPEDRHGTRETQGRGNAPAQGAVFFLCAVPRGTR